MVWATRSGVGLKGQQSGRGGRCEGLGRSGGREGCGWEAAAVGKEREGGLEFRKKGREWGAGVGLGLGGRV